MPDLTSLQGLIIVLLAIVPGYTAIAMYRRTDTYERPATDLRTVIPAIGVSFVIQVLVFPLTTWLLLPNDVRNHLIDHPKRVWIWSLVVILVVPVVGGLAAGRLAEAVLIWGNEKPAGWKRLVTRLFPQIPPSAWDMFFLQKLSD